MARRVLKDAERTPEQRHRRFLLASVEVRVRKRSIRLQRGLGEVDPDVAVRSSGKGSKLNLDLAHCCKGRELVLAEEKLASYPCLDARVEFDVEASLGADRA